MTVLMVDVAAPSVADARRAARPLLETGAEEVWLFGSVARGEATERSDIDLLVLFADIDYSKRHELRRRLESAAAEAVDSRWPVQVFVTDRPEWKARSERVRSSFEYRIGCSELIRVGDAGCRGGVRWNKPMERPVNDLDEALSKFDDEILSELIRLQRDTVPGETETSEHYSTQRRENARLWRMVDMSSTAELMVEKSIKNLAAWHREVPPSERELRTAGHDIGACLGLLPTSVRLGVSEIVNSLNFDLGTMSSMRVKRTYPDDKLVLQTIADRVADNFVMAALEVTAILHWDLAAAIGPHDDAFGEVSSEWRAVSEMIGQRDVRTGESAQSPYQERVVELSGRKSLLDAGPERPLRLSLDITGEL